MWRFVRVLRRQVRILALPVVTAVSLPAHAVLQDEIQVYDDSINDPGQWGLELHVNSTPSGPQTPLPNQGMVDTHGYRGTPEISYGLTPTLEAGVYLPVVSGYNGTTEFAGPRFRLKWIPQRAPVTGGEFYGLNVEVSDIKPVYQPSQQEVELRSIIGYRNDTWLLVANPTLDYSPRPGYRQNGPVFSPDFKVGRTVMPGLSAGFEYYTELGTMTNLFPYSQQNNVLFAAMDVNMKPWVFNLGVGRGLTQSSDGWTIKAIFEIPID
ncbi:MAG: hypothetical protein G3H99_02585 [Ferrovum sp.]|nr:hypothetical protein [Ferrovum sp.]